MDASNSLLAIDKLIEDNKQLEEVLFMDEPSLTQSIQKYLKKMFVLSCASNYEAQIVMALKVYAQLNSNKYKSKPHGFEQFEDYSFFRMFDFDKENKIQEARAFLAPLKFFGKEFKLKLVNEVINDTSLNEKMKAFQKMCLLRNSLTHNDLISKNDAIEAITFDGVKNLHKDAIMFVNYMMEKLS